MEEMALTFLMSCKAAEPNLFDLKLLDLKYDPKTQMQQIAEESISLIHKINSIE